jgi:hypothetical protein
MATATVGHAASRFSALKVLFTLLLRVAEQATSQERTDACEWLVLDGAFSSTEGAEAAWFLDSGDPPQNKAHASGAGRGRWYVWQLELPVICNQPSF